MKIAILALSLAASTASAQTPAPSPTPATLTTLSGHTYKQARVFRVEPDGINYVFAGGMVKIPFTELFAAFLGLRRYLRQRRLEMPKIVTAAWLILGAGLLIAFIVIGAVLPRPLAEFSPLALTRADVKVSTASKYALSEGDQGNPGSWVWIGVEDADALFNQYRITDNDERSARATVD